MKSPSHPLALALTTGLALIAFAGNSILTRAALADAAIAPTMFAAVRLLAGALTLLGVGAALGLRVRPRREDVPAIAALAGYAIAFSLAYVALAAATGALILFAAVQFTMVGAGLLRGNRLSALQVAGLVLAMAGLVWLLSPGVVAPPLGSAALMSAAGVAWGVYSVLGQGSVDPTARTARNFIGAAPLALALLLVALGRGETIGASAIGPGLALAVASGAITSAGGYVLWYIALPKLSSFAAANLQLSVPAITAVGSLLWLGEPLTTALVGASVIILAGIALSLRRPKTPSAIPPEPEQHVAPRGP